eukprot:TRINITY_DN15547_c0_g1_i1.p1 TRINITY_DN15547_c0_g1~~TRINITY_DN15547_c0_g1_i1.p1  ORF type:complete len:906 (-),score=152.71 TRINITY_DN15547_c0_g1_i1:14-2461(-)
MKETKQEIESGERSCQNNTNPAVKCFEEPSILDKYQPHSDDLKFSLRSVEKFVPWVRHIYIVTNGQIPRWLNLNNPTLSVVTHDELFQNKSHLPTFNVPAIENHFHEIPGISDTFLYVSDGIYFGREVFPDDFITQSRGQKVFLAGNVPLCHEGCTSSMIGDTYCDDACNNTQCFFDGGDCRNGTSSRRRTPSWSRRGPTSVPPLRPQTYCARSCPDNWIGDATCDYTCKNVDCGFDGGDCGFDLIKDAMIGFNVTAENETIVVPEKRPSIYINVSELLGTDTIVEGLVHNPEIVRTATLTKQSYILVLTLREPNSKERSKITFSLIPANTTEKIERSFFLEQVVPMVNQATTPPASAINTNGTVATEVPVQTITAAQSGNQTLATNGTTSVPTPPAPKEVHAPLFIKLIAPKAPTPPPHFPTPRGQPPAPNTETTTPTTTTTTPTNSTTTLTNSTTTDLNTNLTQSPNNTSTNETNFGTSRTLLSLDLSESTEELYPWEIDRLNDRMLDNGKVGRKLLNAFDDSLKFVDMLYTKEFGYVQRKVPSRAPHLFNRTILNQLHNRWNDLFEETSSHRFPTSKDMEFAFSYSHFLMHQKQTFDFETAWTSLDVDNDGKLNDNELHTLGVLIHGTGVTSSQLTTLKSNLKNNTTLSEVTKNVFEKNDEIISKLKSKTVSRAQNKYEVAPEDIAVLSLKETSEKLAKVLDSFRDRRNRFVYVNYQANLSDPRLKDGVEIIHEFHESFFPLKSQFELPEGIENEYLNIDELRIARKWTNWRWTFIYWGLGALILMICFTVLQRRLTDFSDCLSEPANLRDK